MFPFSFSKTIEIPIMGNNVESVSRAMLHTLEGYIRAENPNSISSNEHQIIFSDSNPPIRFISKWDFLKLIDHGAIEFIPGEYKLLVSYKFWFTGLFISSSLLTITLALCIFSLGFTFPNLAIALGIGLCYFVYNFIRTVVGFHDLIRLASVI